MSDTSNDPIPVQTYRKTYFTCPYCRQHEFRITESHCNGDYRWTCQVCSANLHIVVGKSIDEITVQHGSRPNDDSVTVRGYSLLRYRGGGRPQFIIVDDLEFVKPGRTAEDHRSSHDYRYDSATCPTNYLDVRHIHFNGDGDPHGIYAFVRFVSKESIRQAKGWTWEQYEKEVHNADTEFWLEVFPEMNKTSTTDERSTYDTFDDEIEDAVIIEAEPTVPKGQPSLAPPPRALDFGKGFKGYKGGQL